MGYRGAATNTRDGIGLLAALAMYTDAYKLHSQCTHSILVFTGQLQEPQGLPCRQSWWYNAESSIVMCIHIPHCTVCTMQGSITIVYVQQQGPSTAVRTMQGLCMMHDPA